MFKSNKKLAKLFCKTSLSTLDDDDFNAFLDFFNGTMIDLDYPEDYYESDILDTANITKFAIENSKPIYKFIDPNEHDRVFYLIPGTAKEISSKLDDYIKLRHFK